MHILWIYALNCSVFESLALWMNLPISENLWNCNDSYANKTLHINNHTQMDLNFQTGFTTGKNLKFLPKFIFKK